MIKHILRSPAHLVADKKKPATPALEFGAGFHLALQDYVRYEKQYLVLPYDDLRTKKAKEWKAEIEADGKHMVRKEDREHMDAMIRAINEHPDIGPYLAGDTDVELSGYWYYPGHEDLLCKFRLDMIYKPDRIIFDFKSCQDAREGPFRRQAYNVGYHIQAGWYSYGATVITGVEHNDVRLVAVEKQSPYGIQVHKAEPEVLFEGQRECARAVGIYLKCLESDEWPCYEPGVRPWSLPGWVKRSMESL